MPLTERFSTDKSVIAVWKINETVAQLVSMYPDDVDTLLIASGAGSEERILERLAVRCLMHTLLPEDTVKIMHDDNGKPFLDGLNTEISVSHTKGYAAVMLSSGCLPGIDIEVRGPRAARLSSRFLNEHELLSFFQGIDPDSATLMWSAKESVYKTVGRPLTDFRKTMSVCDFFLQTATRSGTCMTVVAHMGNNVDERFGVSYVIRPDYVLTWTERLF